MLCALTSDRSSSRIRFAQGSGSDLVVVLESEAQRERERSRIVVGQSHKVKSIVPKTQSVSDHGRRPNAALAELQHSTYLRSEENSVPSGAPRSTGVLRRVVGRWGLFMPKPDGTGSC